MFLQFKRHAARLLLLLTQIVNVYVPQVHSSGTVDQQVFWNAIAPVLSASKCPIVVAGDTNARRSCRATSAILREASTFLSDTSCELGLVDNFSCHPTKRCSENGLDRIFVQSRFRSSLQDYCFVTPPVFSDHKLVAARIRIKWCRCSQAKAKVRKDFSALPKFLAQVDSEHNDLDYLTLKDAVQNLPTIDRAPKLRRCTWESDYIQDLLL